MWRSYFVVARRVSLHSLALALARLGAVVGSISMFLLGLGFRLVRLVPGLDLGCLLSMACNYIDDLLVLRVGVLVMLIVGCLGFDLVQYG